MPRSVCTPRNIPDLLRGVVFFFCFAAQTQDIYIFLLFLFSTRPNSTGIQPQPAAHAWLAIAPQEQHGRGGLGTNPCQEHPRMSCTSLPQLGIPQEKRKLRSTKPDLGNPWKSQAAAANSTGAPIPRFRECFPSGFLGFPAPAHWLHWRRGWMRAPSSEP